MSVRALKLCLVVALAALVFPDIAFAQTSDAQAAQVSNIQAAQQQQDQQNAAQSQQEQANQEQQQAAANQQSKAPDMPAAGSGYWGTLYHSGGCGSSTTPYGGYDNKPLNGGQCYNLVTDKVWDSITLNKGDALQIQLYDRQNCDTGSGAKCAIWNHAMDKHCVTSLNGGPTGNFFARSIKIIENGDSSLNSKCAVNP